MNSKTLTYVSVSVAVVAAAIAAIVVSNNRATVARARAAKAENRAIAAEREAKKAEMESMKEENAKAKAAREAETKKAEAEKAKQDAKIAEEEARLAAADAEKAKAEAEAKRAEAAKAASESEKAKAEAKKAAAELQTVRARAEADLAKSNAAVQYASMLLAQEERRTAAVLAEARTLELRKLDFESLERDLLELQHNLEERERALMPDATIYNSSNVEWVAEGEAEVIGADTNRLLQAHRKIADEDNLAMPAETRSLAKRNRRALKELDVGLALSQKHVVGRLAKLYAEALREGRVIDADFYLKSIRLYDPVWDSKAYLSKAKEGK